MKKPLSKIHHTARETVSLAFADGKRGEFIMRGAVCWPAEPDESSMRFTGRAIVAGKSVVSGTVYLFDEMAFCDIEPVVDRASGCVQEPGLSGFLNAAFNVWGCPRFCWYGNEVLHEQYARAVRRSALVNPKPHWRRVLYDPSEGLRLVADWSARGKLVVWEDLPMAEDLRRARATPGYLPLGVRCLGSLLFDYARIAWRGADKPYEDAAV